MADGRYLLGWDDSTYLETIRKPRLAGLGWQGGVWSGLAGLGLGLAEAGWAFLFGLLEKL